ncbi:MULTISPECIES: hypothetical protein [Enterobacteriaceae]|nr:MULTISPECIES: hypothetical protein [Enterobacteriaceae]EBD7297261.1 hypothetical protein [Salmonella enterica subsp. enterica]ECB7829653.1 hypothetical protein [Salmonella enterica subsp. enterica serovar Jodhpur]ECP8318231.1 hypothetical protein [Salmonella enterica subsp. enterica serovar Poona]EEO6133896.1 hypothetical protein [Salmonella enterica]MDM3504426.1 hypothetical protein [Enterobacter cloacae]HDX4341683.1 hypothetical protein [Enterobacter hormaechei subsp. hoffmannii]
MKKSLIALLLITSASSYADKIPVSIENVIAGTNAREHSLKNGELTVRYDRSKVTQDMATAMFDWICNDYFMNKWKPETIKRVTLLNITRDQGYKIDAGGNECKKSGSMTFEQEKAYKANIIENATQF